MKLKYLILIVIFSFSLHICVYSEDAFEKLYEEIKVNEDDLSMSNLIVLKNYIIHSKVLPDESKLNYILEKYSNVTAGDILINIAKIEKMLIGRGYKSGGKFTLKMMTNPDNRNSVKRFLYDEFRIVCDDMDGRYLLKYKYIYEKDDKEFLRKVNFQFSSAKYRTFRALFIKRLSHSIITPNNINLYLLLKDRLFFINVLPIEEFKLLDSKNKLIEMHKMAVWINENENIEFAFDIWSFNILNEFKELTIKNYDNYMVNIIKNYGLAESFSSVNDLASSGIDKEKEFLINKNVISNLISAWFEKNKDLLNFSSKVELKKLDENIYYYLNSKKSFKNNKLLNEYYIEYRKFKGLYKEKVKVNPYYGKKLLLAINSVKPFNLRIVKHYKFLSEKIKSVNPLLRKK